MKEERQSKAEIWLGVGLVLFAWGAELIEELDLPLWVRVVRATFITILLIGAFGSSQYLYGKIIKGERGWYWMILAFVILSGLAFLFNSLFIDPEAIEIDQSINYITVYISDMFVAYSIIMAMFMGWAYGLFNQNKKNELALSQLATLRKETELDELKKQLNPHFLFNALSNIYSIAYLGDKETPDKILQLSKMLRYVIYETDVEKILLSKEIEYIEYFIDFQKFRIKKEQQIDFDCKNVNGELKLAPLLLLPFIENAFKHSQIDVELDAWVRGQLITEGNEIYFFVENTISKNVKPAILNNKGIGLENIKKRLELIYNKNAELVISSEETFRVELKIKV